jgi:two-component system, sensor histidine kinase and response regulator
MDNEKKPPLRILVVDDDPVQRQMATAFLGMGGHRAKAVEGGRAALDLLASEAFDIVLLDHDMPDITGLAVLMEIRSRGLIDKMPVVLVTSRDDVALIDRAFELGASGFTTKPVNWQLMQHEIRFLIRAADNERAAGAARDAALRLSATKDQLLNIARHELKTPMNAIIGFGRIVRDGLTVESPVRSSADEMLEAAHRMNARILDMMACLDLASGRISPAFAAERPAWIVEEQLPRWLKAAADKGVAVVIADEAPGATVQIDAAHLTDMLDRLVDNALRHGKAPRTITLRLTLRDAATLALSVEDDGAGIAPDRIAQCREAFGQSDMTSSRGGEGLGLGLHIVQGLAGLNGGRFELASAGAGQGTVATVLLPLVAKS